MNANVVVALVNVALIAVPVLLVVAVVRARRRQAAYRAWVAYQAEYEQWWAGLSPEQQQRLRDGASVGEVSGAPLTALDRVIDEFDNKEATP